MSEAKNTRVNMENYIDNILAENLTLKRKLESKCEALSILSKELEKSNHQREELKLMGEQLQDKYINLKKVTMKHDDMYCEDVSSNSYHNDLTKSLRIEVDSLRQKLRDALGDVKALRGKLNQQRHNSVSEENVGVKQLDKEEKLVKQLEEAYRLKQQLHIDFQAVLDEKEELVTERDAYKCKVHRLNHEFNTLLKGDNRSLIDLDALIMENRFLQEHLQQAQEEQKLASQTIARYKSMLEKKRIKGTVRFGTDNGSGLLLSQKQVHELLEQGSATQLPNTPATLADLRSLCVALLESLSDKTLALSHQKKANRILAARISQLQQRLEVVQGAEVISFPSQVLLQDYAAHDVDKDVVVSLGEERAHLRMEQHREQQQQQQHQQDVAGKEADLDDGELPPRLAELVEQALVEIKQQQEAK